MSDKIESAKTKKGEQKNISPWTIIIILIIVSIGITFHIYQVLTVNAFVIKNDELKKRFNKVQMVNESLKNEIESLASLQRILPQAKELGLEYNRDEIKYLDIDKNN
jgi:cell division protein FtsL